MNTPTKHRELQKDLRPRNFIIDDNKDDEDLSDCRLTGFHIVDTEVDAIEIQRLLSINE